MRSRLVLALLAVAACKGKSADKADEPAGSGGATNTTSGSGTVGAGSAVSMGSGSAVVVAKPDPGTLDQEQQGKVGAVRDKGAPDQPTKVAVSDGFQAATARGDATLERRAAGGVGAGSASAPSSAPAVPTPAGGEDGIAAAPPKVDVTTAGPVAIVDGRALDDSTLTVDAVTTKIRSAYTATLRRCAAGKSGAVSIALTVNETGRVAEVTSGEAFDKQVAACIVERAKYFVFRVPTSNATMNPAKARFAMTFQLRSP